MRVLKKYGANLLIWVILIGMILVRIMVYGNLNLSVGTADTASYIQGGTGPVFSKTMLTKSRLFTTNLLYYWAGAQKCELQTVSYPARGTETYRNIQPCFNRVVFFQNALSIIAWSTLALVVSKRLSGGYEKLLAVSLITAFGFTPSIADWDSILGSESLTFSLFAISIALIIEVCFNIIAGEKNSKYSIFINGLAIATLILWAFTRDTNIYALAVLFFMSIIPVIALPGIRKNKIPLVFIAAIFITTIIGLQSAMTSKRWARPMTNVFTDIVLPYPARVQFMQTLGMPDPASAVYPKWFTENAPRAYARFLLLHPGFAFTSLTSQQDGVFSENVQPYFFSEQTSARKTMVVFNDIMHPKTYHVFILDCLLIMGLIFAVFRRKNKKLTTWVWLGTWLFVNALLTLTVSYFADSIGLTRHTLFSVELFRLTFWVFLIILFDQANRKDEEVSALS